jgi:hypothetical protein
MTKGLCKHARYTPPRVSARASVRGSSAVVYIRRIDMLFIRHGYENPLAVLVHAVDTCRRYLSRSMSQTIPSQENGQAAIKISCL